MSESSSIPSRTGELRQRQNKEVSGQPRQGDLHDESAATKDGPTATASESLDSGKVKKTYGRTPDGTVFIVPTTHDMVSQLLDPRQPKNLSDAVVIGILLLHILAAYLIPSPWKRTTFAVVFLLWRAAYNIGIGILLNLQSNHRRMITWAHRSKIFENPKDGNNSRPWLYRFLQRELEAKIPEDYDFEKAPVEYNTWLVFRKLVDLILMCDFTSYCLFAVICGRTPEGEGILVGVGRWSLGLALVGFNLWVKLDAHRVVKDFAWYWGDFFYLIDQDLTFDGVFEMAPHPMYSIGYAGFYGISIMAASYEVLFISIVAHAAQFAFLVTVETPHIEKTYNPPPKRKRLSSKEILDTVPEKKTPEDLLEALERPATPSQTEAPLPTHNLVGFSNLDFYRVPDSMAVILPMYVAVLTFGTPNTVFWQAIFVVHALIWRVWYHLGLGIILDRQSSTKAWTRHFLKYGESAGEAWREWKGLYHISMIMCNTSFIAACWKMYTLPSDWGYGLVLLKHVLGAGLIALQLWTAFSVYDSLGEFGWFCGDFFFDHRAKLNYTSIYRFLNNPERFFGVAGVWGAALITWSRAIFVMAIITQCLTFIFISYIERPHMQKIYGRGVREEAGLTKFIRNSLPTPVRALQQSVDRVIDDTTHFVEDFLDSARPMFASGVKTIVRDTSTLFNTAPARLTITRIPSEVAGLDVKKYTLSVQGTVSAYSSERDYATGKEGLNARFRSSVHTVTYEYGTPLKVKWTAPVNHSKKDWIGLYKLSDNRSREKTETSSLGRWAPTSSGSYDALTADTSIVTPEHAVSDDLVEGEVLFTGDKLWWTKGVFEFRYHHHGGHIAMAISEPFEINIPKFDEDDVDIHNQTLYEKALESTLLPTIQNCLDQDPDIAPNTLDEAFGSPVQRDGKYAKRIVYAIREMFGIEFAPVVVLADGNVRKLAWRIRNAKDVLAPYSMSHSKGTTTPTNTTEHEQAEKV